MNHFSKTLILVLSVAVALVGFPTIAAAELFTPTKVSSNWDADCNAAECDLIHEEKPGANRRVLIEIVGSTHKVRNVRFAFTGDIDETKGFVAVFLRTQLDASRAECKDRANIGQPSCYSQSANGSFGGSFLSCQEGLCFVVIHGQYADDARTKAHVDLLDEFKKDDLILFLFKDKEGNLRRQAMDISGFQEAYQVALRNLK